MSKKHPNLPTENIISTDNITPNASAVLSLPALFTPSLLFTSETIQMAAEPATDLSEKSLELENLSDQEYNLDLDVDPESEKAQSQPPSKKQAIQLNQQASSYSNIAIIPPSAVALQEKTIEEQPLKKRPRSKKLECPFGCPSSQTFNQEALATHIIANHPGKRSFPCLKPGCSKGYDNRKSLARHKQTDHQGKRFDCLECFKNFKQPEALKLHMSKKHPNLPTENIISTD